jgi:hypothetical protein
MIIIKIYMNYYYILFFLLIIFAFQTVISNIKTKEYTDFKTLSPILAQSNINNGESQTVDYYARFNCGTIDNDNGPLRPGKYDSDITIFNRQTFPLTIIWKPIEINQENKNNFQTINIQPENIVNINCAKIFPSSSAIKKGFVEGIALIRINVENGQLINNFLNNQGQFININSQQLNNLINVDVLHTVNTLDDLKKEVLFLKVDFLLNNNNGKKISQQTNEDNLTAIFQVEPNLIIDPHILVKNIINNNYSSSNSQHLSDNTIKVIGSRLFSNTLTDNHALTFQKVVPTITNTTNAIPFDNQ